MTMDRKLEVTLPSDTEIALTRAFDAPRRLVFDAWTKPELLTRWLGVRNGWTFETCEVDLREGGTYRYVWRGAKGQALGLRGTFHEIVAPERIVSTEKFDDPWYEGTGHATVTFVERDGTTTVTMLIRYDDKRIRDAAAASGMDRGVAESYAVLDGVLAAMPARSTAGG